MWKRMVTIAAIAAASISFAMSQALAEDDDLTLEEAEDLYEFTQTRTCTPSGVNRCEPGEVPLPVQWSRSTVEYWVNERGSQAIEPESTEITDEIKEAVFDSFDAWNEVECSDFEMIYGGKTTIDEVGHDPDGDSINVLIWQDEHWPYPTYDAVALTIVSYVPCNGEILSADIEFNTADYIFTNHEGAAGTQIDLRNTLTHEVGHFLGLDHSPNEAATMYATAPPGEITKRDLHQADREGLCFIYPEGESYELEPCGNAGASDEEKSRWFCASTSTFSGSSFLFALFALLGLFGLRRRSHR